VHSVSFAGSRKEYFEKLKSFKANLIMTTKWLFLAAAGFFLLPVRSVLAQNNNDAQPNVNSASMQTYDVSREQTLVGTVLAQTFSSRVAPLGPHLSLQTASGVVDVHLGDTRILSANHFTIQAGDTLRIIGENVVLANHASQFLARVLQNGTQAIVVRTIHGFPIPPTISGETKNGKKQAGVM
jgi:hypothetical protein